MIALLRWFPLTCVIVALGFALAPVLDLLLAHLGLVPVAVFVLGLLIVRRIVDRAQRGGDG